MSLRYVIFFVLFLFLITTGFSFEKDIDLIDIKKGNGYFYFIFDFDLLEKFEEDDVFVMNVKYEDIDREICSVPILTSEGGLFKKIICEAEYLGVGEYKFEGKVLRDGEIIYSFQEIIYDAKEVYGYYEFQHFENSTKVIMNFDGEMGPARIYSSIPSSVIPLLSDENKDELITSELDFEIVEENPLIAWNVEEVPDKVEYEVEKEIDENQTRDFSMRIEESASFEFMKYGVFIGIIVILLIIFLPAFKKK